MKKYFLNLDIDGRILSVGECIEGIEYAVVVESFPDGDVGDYKYINGEYVHDPLPTPEETPTVEEDTLSMLVDHEERIINLELGLTEQKGA